MKILNTTANVSTKTPFYIQSCDLGTPRVVRWVIPSVGTLVIWGRMDSNDTWIDLVDSTVSDETLLTLMPQMAATLADIDTGTVVVHVDVTFEARGLHNYAG